MNNTVIKRKTTSKGIVLTFTSNGHAKGMRFRNESEFQDFVSYLMALVVCGADTIEKI
jgi:hypothetical protein